MHIKRSMAIKSRLHLIITENLMFTYLDQINCDMVISCTLSINHILLFFFITEQKTKSALVILIPVACRCV